MGKISVVINTRNEESNLPRLLTSIKDLADEIVVVDMFSMDNTVAIAKKAGAVVFTHPATGYVEPARNFAIGKAKGDWILILDADEEVPQTLALKLKKIAGKEYDFYRLPRKNIIFGKWINHSRWWPDYNTRFFKKGTVRWSSVIHSVPETKGQGMDLPPEESFAIIHHNYASISQYLLRMNRYTDIQAKFLIAGGYKFSWPDILRKPTSEFVGRFFAGEGFKDGVHGLVLCILQAFSELVVYTKVWEMEKFKEIPLSNEEIESELAKTEKELDHWLTQKTMRRKRLGRRLAEKLLR